MPSCKQLSPDKIDDETVQVPTVPVERAQPLNSLRQRLERSGIQNGPSFPNSPGSPEAFEQEIPQQSLPLHLRVARENNRPQRLIGTLEEEAQANSSPFFPRTQPQGFFRPSRALPPQASCIDPQKNGNNDAKEGTSVEFTVNR